jgi:endonuclease/exonuclease/phosphatase family metal-dependent hydrolase
MSRARRPLATVLGLALASLCGACASRGGDARTSPTGTQPPREFVRVASFNLAASVIDKLYPTDIQLELWGKGLMSHADIVLLQEVADADWVRILSQSSGLPYWYAPTGQRWPPMVEWSQPTDLAILSRFPIVDSTYDVQAFVVENVLTRNTIALATVLIDGAPHRVANTHFSHHPNRFQYSAERLAGVQKVLDLTKYDPVVFFGGDLNACPKATPTSDPPFSCIKREDTTDVHYPYDGYEVDALAKGGLSDAFAVPNAPPLHIQHCDNARIDYVFWKGPYWPVLAGCPFDPFLPLRQTSAPSDHNLIFVQFASLPVRIPAPPRSLNAVAAGKVQINLDWADKADNARNYYLERCEGVSCTAFAQVAEVSGLLRQHYDRGLKAKTTYSYRLRGRVFGGFSGYSNIATATTAAAEHPDCPDLRATIKKAKEEVQRLKAELDHTPRQNATKWAGIVSELGTWALERDTATNEAQAKGCVP